MVVSLGSYFFIAIGFADDGGLKKVSDQSTGVGMMTRVG